MILYTKDGCIASGTVTSKGGVLSYIGDRGTPKFSFSIQYANEKRADGTWKRSYMDCEIFGQQAEDAPALEGREMVLVCGRIEDRAWTGRDGEKRVSRTLKCDFLTVSGGGGERSVRPVAVSPPDNFDSLDGDDGGDLPF